MRYQNEQLQDRLAAEFALGNLRGAARNRLLALMRLDPGLRAKVAQWEERMFPLVMRAPPVEAPARVWRAIHARISAHGAPRRRWRGWFARLSVGGLAAAALALLLFIATAPPRAPAFVMVAVLNDEHAQPAILVSWTPAQAARRQLALRILAHPEMPAGTSWQAWVLPGAGAAPVSLGLVSGDENQLLDIPAAAASALSGAVVIGVSVEPVGGSPSGRPGGPFVFQGLALRVDS